MPHTWDDRTGESKEGIIGVPESAVPRMRHNGFEPVKSTGAHTWATCGSGCAYGGGNTRVHVALRPQRPSGGLPQVGETQNPAASALLVTLP